MAHIVIANIGMQGHLNPTLPIVNKLTGFGHRVTYFATEPFRRPIRHAGAHFISYDSLLGVGSPLRANIRNRAHFFSVRLLEESLHVLPQLEKSMADLKPDLLIYDRLCLAGKFVADRLGIPKAAFFPSYAANENFSVRQRFPLPAVDTDTKETLDELRNALRERYGIVVQDSDSMMMQGEVLNIVFLPRAFQISGDTFDERYVFVGPCIGCRAEEKSWTPSSETHQKRLLISFGTIFNELPELYRTCLRAFENTDWEVLMAVGKHVDISSLGTIPRNVIVAPHLPQLDILPHVRVLITHGGMNSTMEALHFGVPTIVIPQASEQKVTAQRVVELDLGRDIESDAISAEFLLQISESVASDNRIRRGVKAMQKEIAAAGGPDRAVSAINKLLAQGAIS